MLFDVLNPTQKLCALPLCIKVTNIHQPSSAVAGLTNHFPLHFWDRIAGNREEKEAEGGETAAAPEKIDLYWLGFSALS